MDDVHRAPFHVARVVRVVQRLQHLHDDEHARCAAARARALRAGAQQPQRVEAVDELERDEVLAGDVAEVEDLDDLRVRQLRRQLGLVDEHRDERRVGGQVRKDPLDDDDLLEAVRRDDLRAEDLGHSADGQPLDQRVAAELRGKGDWSLGRHSNHYNIRRRSIGAVSGLGPFRRIAHRAVARAWPAPLRWTPCRVRQRLRLSRILRSWIGSCMSAAELERPVRGAARARLALFGRGRGREDPLALFVVTPLLRPAARRETGAPSRRRPCSRRTSPSPPGAPSRVPWR